MLIWDKTCNSPLYSQYLKRSYDVSTLLTWLTVSFELLPGDPQNHSIQGSDFIIWESLGVTRVSLKKNTHEGKELESETAAFSSSYTAS